MSSRAGSHSMSCNNASSSCSFSSSPRAHENPASPLKPCMKSTALRSGVQQTQPARPYLVFGLLIRVRAARRVCIYMKPTAAPAALKTVLPFFLAFRFGHKLISETANGEQVTRLGRLLLDIPAEPHDEVIDGAGVGIFMESPDLL